MNFALRNKKERVQALALQTREHLPVLKLQFVLCCNSSLSTFGEIVRNNYLCLRNCFCETERESKREVQMFLTERIQNYTNLLIFNLE